MFSFNSGRLKTLVLKLIKVKGLHCNPGKKLFLFLKIPHEKITMAYGINGRHAAGDQRFPGVLAE